MRIEAAATYVCMQDEHDRASAAPGNCRALLCCDAGRQPLAAATTRLDLRCSNIGIDAWQARSFWPLTACAAPLAGGCFCAFIHTFIASAFYQCGDPQWRPASCQRDPKPSKTTSNKEGLSTEGRSQTFLYPSNVSHGDAAPSIKPCTQQKNC